MICNATNPDHGAEAGEARVVKAEGVASVIRNPRERHRQDAALAVLNIQDDRDKVRPDAVALDGEGSSAALHPAGGSRREFRRWE